MMPNSATPRERPDRSVNMTAQVSPKRSQIRESKAAVSAPGLSRFWISFSRRSSDALLAIWTAYGMSGCLLVRHGRRTALTRSGRWT